jgi:hypothetical protein
VVVQSPFCHRLDFRLWVSGIVKTVERHHASSKPSSMFQSESRCTNTTFIEEFDIMSFFSAISI